MFAYLNTIRKRSTHMFMTVARIMIPIMVIMYVADRLGWIKLAGNALSPAMGLLGLPPEAGIVWATTMLTNIYGGIAAMAALSEGLEMNVAQVSALGAMMLFVHNLPTEQAIVRRAGASALFTAALRVFSAIIFGAGVAWICHFMSWMQEPVSFAWMHQDQALAQGPPNVWQWLLSTTQSMLLVFAIIFVLVIFLDALESLGITRQITRLLTPVLRISGLDERAAPLTTVGVMLGLAYGGALIIDAAEREDFDPRTRLLALAWLSLFHSLIEDTLLIVALGANIWVVLVLRGLFTLLVMAALARLTGPQTPWGRRLAT